MKFGKLNDGKIEYAPSVITNESAAIFAPNEAQYLACGWKRLHLAAPTEVAPSGYHYEADGYDETDSDITARWRTVENAVIPRKFSKLKIYGAIAQLGAWSAIQTWLEGKTVNGVNGWMAFQLAQDISDDHPMFAALADEARQMLGLDAASFEALLSQCLLED